MAQSRPFRWRLDLAALRAWTAASSDGRNKPGSSISAAPAVPAGQKSASDLKSRHEAVQAELTLARKRIDLLEQQNARLKFDLSQAKNQITLLDQQRSGSALSWRKLKTKSLRLRLKWSASMTASANYFGGLAFTKAVQIFF